MPCASSTHREHNVRALVFVREICMPPAHLGGIQRTCQHYAVCIKYTPRAQCACSSLRARDLHATSTSRRYPAHMTREQQARSSRCGQGLHATSISQRNPAYTVHPPRTGRLLRAHGAHTGSAAHRPRSAPAATDSHTRPLQRAARPPGPACLRRHPRIR